MGRTPDSRSGSSAEDSVQANTKIAAAKKSRRRDTRRCYHGNTILVLCHPNEAAKRIPILVRRGLRPTEQFGNLFTPRRPAHLDFHY